MAFHAELVLLNNKLLNFVLGMTVIHRTLLSGRRLALP